MTDLSINTEAFEAIVNSDADTNHITCCKDDLISLCNKEIDNFTPPNENDIDCRVCDFLFTTDFCPRGLVCPEVPIDKESPQ
jgi:hypothetical protein